MNVMTFHQTQIKVVDQGGQPWMLGPDIARALGYDKADAISKLYQRHKCEFEGLSTTVKLTGVGDLPRTTRVFSPRGALLLAMHANTDRAAAFRSWVLDVLEGKVPLPGFTDHRLVMAEAILEHQPRWQSIRRYKGLGLTYPEIGKLLDISRATVGRDVRDMRRLGLELAA